MLLVSRDIESISFLTEEEHAAIEKAIRSDNWAPAHTLREAFIPMARKSLTSYLIHPRFLHERVEAYAIRTLVSSLIPDGSELIFHPEWEVSARLLTRYVAHECGRNMQ